MKVRNVLTKFCIAACMAACVFTAACTDSANNINENPSQGTENTVTGREDFKNGLEKLRYKADAFGSQFAAKAYMDYDKDDNFVVSPVSVFSALSLAAECAAGDTREEIISALGVDYDNLQTDFSKFFSSLNTEFTERESGGDVVAGRIQLTNSVWVDSTVSAKQQCLDALSDKYSCDSYSAEFGTDNVAANEAVRKFVKEKTYGLIDKDFKISPETAFTLINTLYLKDIWNYLGEDLSFTDKQYSFIEADGDIKKVNLLRGYYNDGRAYEDKNFTSFYTTTEHGVTIKFIVPKNGYSVSDVFTAENISKVNAIKDYRAHDSENEYKLYVTRCLFPEYKADYDDDVTGILKSMGITSLFDKSKCNFSNLSDGELYCEGVQHVTDLTVDKKGVEGAAVTVMPIASSAYHEYEYFDFYVNKAFGFIITDWNGDQLFTGVVNEI